MNGRIMIQQKSRDTVIHLDVRIKAFVIGINVDTQDIDLNILFIGFTVRCHVGASGQNKHQHENERYTAAVHLNRLLADYKFIKWSDNHPLRY